MTIPRMKIMTVCCQHGGERFGVLIGFELLKLGCSVELANPRAFLKGKRFFDTEQKETMFMSTGGTYDRAQFDRIRMLSDEHDLVIDLHSTRANVGVVTIANQADDLTLAITAQLGIAKLAVMPAHVYRNTLSGNTTAKVISLEFGSNYTQTEQTAKQLANRIADLSGAVPKAAIDVYRIADTLPVTLANSGLRNYRYSPRINGYPFLVGESDYKNHAGFFAHRRETVIVGADG